jgi:hypothetical protein
MQIMLKNRATYFASSCHTARTHLKFGHIFYYTPCSYIYIHFSLNLIYQKIKFNISKNLLNQFCEITLLLNKPFNGLSHEI